MAATNSPETLRDVSDLLKRQDKDRFNRVHNQDSSKIVALSHVTLEQSGESYRFRSETGKDHEHAEIAVVREASEWLDKMMKDLTEQTEISLTTMATSSPCLECQSVILKMLLDWREKLKLTVNYKLRISYLYHDLESTLTAAPKKRLKDPKVRQNLMAWIQAIKDSGVNFTLEAISVCDELYQIIKFVKLSANHANKEGVQKLVELNHSSESGRNHRALYVRVRH